MRNVRQKILSAKSEKKRMEKLEAFIREESRTTLRKTGSEEKSEQIGKT